jgi:hypothetical protein
LAPDSEHDQATAPRFILRDVKDLPKTSSSGGASGKVFQLAGRRRSCPTALRQGTDFMIKHKQRIEELERENERLKNQLLAANEQIAQLKILNESQALQISQFKEKKIVKRC